MAQGRAVTGFPLRGGFWLGALAWLLATPAVLAAGAFTTLSGRAMGTTWTAKFPTGATTLHADALRAGLAAELEQLEQQFSTYRPASDLSRFNRAPAGEWIAVPPELAHVADQARALSAATGGAFDATVGPLLTLWGFGPAGGTGRIPSDKAISAARAQVGWSQLEVQLEPPALRKLQPGLTLDLSSIAKGFAADAMSRWLNAQGLPVHLVQIGGDVRAGRSLGSDAWRLAVEAAAENRNALAAVVGVDGAALSTSGNYRNVVTLEGRRFGHILDPRTGRPVDGPLLAVSVVAPTCAESSGLATALLVLGPDAGWRFATERGLACLFQVRTGTGVELRATDAFARYRRALPE